MTVPDGAPQASNATINEEKSRDETRYTGGKHTEIEA